MVTIEFVNEVLVRIDAKLAIPEEGLPDDDHYGTSVELEAAKSSIAAIKARLEDPAQGDLDWDYINQGELWVAAYALEVAGIDAQVVGMPDRDCYFHEYSPAKALILLDKQEKFWALQPLWGSTEEGFNAVLYRAIEEGDDVFSREIIQALSQAGFEFDAEVIEAATHCDGPGGELMHPDLAELMPPPAAAAAAPGAAVVGLFAPAVVAGGGAGGGAESDAAESGEAHSDGPESDGGTSDDDANPGPSQRRRLS